jgi:hypothetical protein
MNLWLTVIIFKAPMGDLINSRGSQAKDIGILFSPESALMLVSLTLFLSFIGCHTRPMSDCLRGRPIGPVERLVENSESMSAESI